MDNMALKMTEAYLDSREIKYQEIDEEGNKLRVSYNGENVDNISVLIVFSDDNSNCHLDCYNYCKFPVEKIDKMYKICSQMNSKYRWAKFYVDEEDNTITIEADAYIQLDSCGEEILNVVVKIVSIADLVYPEFMKAIWA